MPVVRVLPRANKTEQNKYFEIPPANVGSNAVPKGINNQASSFDVNMIQGSGPSPGKSRINY
jgi:hypothetical protein